jgi:murein lipoprotein
MRKVLIPISLLLAFPATMIGCATTGELEKVEAQQKLIDAKVEQALQDAQAAKAAADAPIVTTKASVLDMGSRKKPLYNS